MPAIWQKGVAMMALPIRRGGGWPDRGATAAAGSGRGGGGGAVERAAEVGGPARSSTTGCEEIGAEALTVCALLHAFPSPLDIGADDCRADGGTRPLPRGAAVRGGAEGGWSSSMGEAPEGET